MRNILVSIFFGLSMIAAAAAEDTPKLESPELTANGAFQVSADWIALKRGWNTLTIQLTYSDGVKADGATIELEYDMTSMPMSPPKAEITPTGVTGLYQTRVFLGMRGQYFFNFKIAVGDKSDTLSHNQLIK